MDFIVVKIPWLNSLLKYIPTYINLMIFGKEPNNYIISVFEFLKIPKKDFSLISCRNKIW